MLFRSDAFPLGGPGLDRFEDVEGPGDAEEDDHRGFQDQTHLLDLPQVDFVTGIISGCFVFIFREAHLLEITHVFGTMCETHEPVVALVQKQGFLLGEDELADLEVAVGRHDIVEVDLQGVSVMFGTDEHPGGHDVPQDIDAHFRSTRIDVDGGHVALDVPLVVVEKILEIPGLARNRKDREIILGKIHVVEIVDVDRDGADVEEGNRKRSDQKAVHGESDGSDQIDPP